ncbi:hypothetical protein NPN19_24130, partial [Vibrio parahaemolyticus]|uniref:hypothetical protein n=1 Tax=Vibrio parahaemolyticus TaxID=670 RepID=UPI002112C814
GLFFADNCNRQVKRFKRGLGIISVQAVFSSHCISSTLSEGLFYYKKGNITVGKPKDFDSLVHYYDSVLIYLDIHAGFLEEELKLIKNENGSLH